MRGSPLKCGFSLLFCGFCDNVLDSVCYVDSSLTMEVVMYLADYVNQFLVSCVIFAPMVLAIRYNQRHGNAAGDAGRDLSYLTDPTAPHQDYSRPYEATQSASYEASSLDRLTSPTYSYMPTNLYHTDC
jgi:hypothetical protein